MSPRANEVPSSLRRLEIQDPSHTANGTLVLGKLDAVRLCAKVLVITTQGLQVRCAFWGHVVLSGRDLVAFHRPEQGVRGTFVFDNSLASRPKANLQDAACKGFQANLGDAEVLCELLARKLLVLGWLRPLTHTQPMALSFLASSIPYDSVPKFLSPRRVLKYSAPSGVT